MRVTSIRREKILLGGRAAELIFLGADCVTSSGGSDLVQATTVALEAAADDSTDGCNASFRISTRRDILRVSDRMRPDARVIH